MSSIRPDHATLNGGFSAVFGELLLVLFRLHPSKFSCIVFPKTELLNSCWKKSKRKLKIFVIVHHGS